MRAWPVSKRIRAESLIVCALLLLGSGCSIPEIRRQSTPVPDPPLPAALDLRELHLLVNQRRAAAGCPALAWDDGLAGVAADHSRDMRERGFFAHETPEGTGVDERVRRAGLQWLRTIGENLAQTGRGPESVARLWVESPAHRANLENCAFRVHGLGRFGEYWTQVLAGGVERS
jgi:uncharacterized protein YkwD